MPTLAKDMDAHKLRQNTYSAELLQSDISKLIDATPTSEKRNKLTDANIHLMSAVEALKKAQTL